MSTARIPNQRNQYQELDTRLARYVRLVQSIYDTLCNKAASAYSLCSHEGGEGVPFSFSDYPETRDAVNKMLRQMVADIHATIYSGITEEWRQSNTAQDLIADKVLKSYTGEVNRQKYTRYYQANSDELNAFKQRTISGMSLSDNLWEQATDCRAELEAAISCAIERGTSAVTLSKQLSQYLKDYKTLKADYKDTFGQAVDIKDCEYRSARLARSEINMAYRTAEQTRWRQFDFVVGYTIKTRDNGKHVGDVCDDLAGDYPKDFKWTGWHPNCMCYEIPILKTDEEFMEYDPENQQKSEREVDNVPDNFVEWVKGNAERINNAKSVPYFIADNRSTVDGIINGTQQMAIAERAKLRHDARTQVEVDDIQYRWNEKRIYDLNQATFDGLLPDECVDAIRELEDLNYSGEYDEFKSRASLLSAAVKRHNERTLDQVEEINNKWAEHQLKHIQIKNTAANVLKVAQDYGEVDFYELQAAIYAGDITKMQYITKSVAKSVSAMKKQEAALADIIPDVHTWHKQFTISDLQTVHTAVEKKLASWSSLTLEQQAKKLKFEAEDFLGGNKNNVQAKYKTWKVSQSAYLKRLADVNYQIDVNAAKSELGIISSWSAKHPKSIKVANLLADAENAINAKEDIVVIKQKVAIAQSEYQQSIAGQTILNANKTSGQFGNDAYTKKRKDAAVWAKDTAYADDVLRDTCGRVWRNAPVVEKDAIYGYTESYSSINEPLRGLTYYGSSTKAQIGLARIPHIESIINKSSYDFDIWLQRGDGMIGLKKFGLSNYDTASDAEIMALVGKTGTEGAFWSAGVAKGKGFGGEVIFNIYAPKGTKMMYCEPFSEYGNGAGRSWDGLSKQSSFGYESEILIQRGTTFRITKVEKSGGTWYIDVDIIEQNTLPFPYAGRYPYK